MSHSNERMMALAIRKSLLKETSNSVYNSGKSGNCSYASLSYTRAVYMNDGDEFQIQLFNPESCTVGCTIYINGSLMSQRKIVLRPGERIWLDRYIDSPDKLKFSTYEVGKSKAAQKAIKDNGVIKVDFYKEGAQKITVSYNPTITWGHTYDPCRTIWDGNTVLGASVDNCVVSQYTSQCYDEVLTAFNAVNYADHDVQCKANKMETGRVEHGGHSDQNFNQVYTDFEWFPYHTEEIKILPMSQKPVHANDLQKRFCPYCGKKVKNGFEFCPYCGKKL